MTERPNGLLLRGAMNSIAEFYSRNLAADGKLVVGADLTPSWAPQVTLV